MVETNVLKGKSKDAIKPILENEFKALGAKSFEIKISPQAKEIIANYGEAFPLEHFKTWILKNKMMVNGGHLHEYLTKDDGFSEGTKKVK